MTATRNLDQSLVRGIAWTGGVRWLVQVISWSATLVIARLLTPADYGLFGMAAVYVGLAQIIGESGLTGAIVQRRELTERDLAAMGGTALLVGLGLAVLSLALATPIAFLYEAPAVRPILMAESAIFVLRGAGVLSKGLLARDLEFRRMAWLDGMEAMALMGLTLVGALLHGGPWALVAGAVGSSAFSTVVALVWRPHRVSWPRDLARLKGAIRFAWQVAVAQLATYAFSNADFAIVGRRLGSSVLGSYTMAWTIASIPVDRVGSLVARVTPACFAAIQDDVAQLGRYLRTLTEALALITLPACVGIALVADRFVPLALGTQWSGAITPLRLLAVYAAIRAVVTLAPQVLIATGRSRLTMTFSIVAAVVLPALFWVGARWGTAGVAAAWVIGYPLIAFIGFVAPALRVSGLTWRAYGRALFPAVAATVAMVAAVLAARAVEPAGWSDVARLMVDITVGALAYTGMLLAIHGPRLRTLWATVRESLVPRAPVTPWLETEPLPGAPRLLLISYHFPPDAAVGGLRWQKLARYVAERGWGLDVVAREPGDLVSRDDDRLSDLPPGVRVYGVRARAPMVDRLIEAAWTAVRPRRRGAAMTGARGAPHAGSVGRHEVRALPAGPRDIVRAYHAVTDYVRGARWAAEARRTALAVHRAGTHRALVTCGPPHMVHYSGREVARLTGLPWVMDLRDPWRLVQRLPEALASPVWWWLASRHERRLVPQANLIVTNTPALHRAMRQAYPRLAGRMLCAPNGADDDAIDPATRERRFVITYAGSIYLDRDPRALFRAVRALVAARHAGPADVVCDFLGNVASYNGAPLAAIARAEGVGDLLRETPRLPRRDALRHLAASAVLVVLPQDSELAVPAKLYDYMQCDAWILAFARPGSAVASLLDGSEADIVDPGDPGAAARALMRRYDQFRRGQRAVRLASDPRFGRRAQADTLLGAIAALAGLPAQPAEEVAACAAS